ncbi:D-alanyl-D-alanine carboxypeptidase family protein [Acidimangrovimonas sediminis]|uniref:D-alanyl-D-alanine carboxypeptidase family protein n=1 Tax=Acidimangrovimonas sediminis TaxID=2056283 RepID=UPI000C80B2A2|nr:D-alanyl-D-alanine carboxypeptidase family protein [Acidimangrovimonas sediminis]
MIRSLAAILIVLAALAAGRPAAAFDTIARSAYVVDVTTGTVLLSKNADAPEPPASMSKLMTIDLLFQALADGRLKMDDTATVSQEAVDLTRKGGSTMYLKIGDRPTIQQLIQGIIVNSGNDACVAVAEKLAGTETAFAKLMNAKAKALGLDHSSFANASGWPDPHQLMSMHDLAMLAIHIIKTYPQFYHFFGETEYDYENRAPGNRFNRNPILTLGIGADGMKTGHTVESGYGLVGSAKRGDRRVLVVLNGLPTEQSRGTEGEKLINWAFGQFTEKTMAKKGEVIARAPVWMGSAPEVALVPTEDVKLLVPAIGADQMSAKVIYTGPLKAPIKAGTQEADLVISAPGMEDRHIPLVAAAEVKRGGVGKRLATAAAVLLRDIAGKAAGY